MSKKIVTSFLLFLVTIGWVIGFDSLVGRDRALSYQISAVLENWSQAIATVEKDWEGQYEKYFEEDFTSLSMTPGRISQRLLDLGQKTGKKPAVLWLMPTTEQLNLYLIVPGKQPIGKENKTVTRRKLAKVTKEFVEEISNLSDNYLDSAQQLYRWLIAPVEADLEAAEVDTLIMCLGAGLRTLPLAALHDGERFLIEKYSLTRIPGFNLTQMSDGNLKNAKVLAMGATQFKEQVDLPAVAVELSAISPQPWAGETILNRGFTVENLQAQRQKENFKIIHLATHADFVPGAPDNSYIQFFDRKLTLDRLHQLGWDDPPVELLVLSACQTAVGDREAELGFAGLALQAGVKSALASLWYVSDAGTLALMSEFYQQLKNTPMKAEALRKSQVALLKGKVYLQQGELVNSRGDISLPPTVAQTKENNLTHPFYWASFTLIGSPW